MTNPYHILGVSTFDDDKKIKAAYKKLKKQYRPKKYKDPELRALAEKKYFEIQNAYLCIQRIRAGKEPDVREAPDTEDLLSNVDFTLLERAKELIEAGDVHEADRLLMKVPTSLHNAEWHYLMARTRVARFYYLDALHLIDTACDLDPNNGTYQAAREEISAKVEEYGSGYRLSPKFLRREKKDRAEGCRDGCCECFCEGGCECCCEILDGVG